jgi:hypothetical protein
VRLGTPVRADAWKPNGDGRHVTEVANAFWSRVIDETILKFANPNIKFLNVALIQRKKNHIA